MPIQKQRDYSPDIKRILAENTKTFEFFALCLAIMIDLPEADRSLIAKSIASDAIHGYYPSVKKDKDKAFKRAFKDTIFQTLTNNFDGQKAASFVNIYTRTRDFYLRSLRSTRSLPSTALIKMLTYRDTQLCAEQKTFIEKLKLKDYTLPENHLEFNRINKLLTSRDAFHRTFSASLIHGASLASTIAVIGFTIYLLAALGLKLLYNDSSTFTFVDLAFLTFIDSIAIMLSRRIIIPATFVFVTKEGIRISEQLKSELISSIQANLKQSAVIDRRNDQTTHDHATPNQVTYHFPLFTLPTINQPSNTPTVHRDQPKIKTRPAFVTPAQPSQPNESQVRKDTYLHNNITFHRVFNKQNLPTQDFIGLDNHALNLDKKALKKINPILEHPQLVAKKGRSGIVNVKSETEKSNKFGLFKIKDKGIDKRFYTERETKTLTLDNETIMLHTASITKQHISKKNN